MVTDLMPKRTKKTDETSRHGQRAAGTKDVFARLDADVVDRFDALVESMQPRTTRSAVIAHLIEQFVKSQAGK